MHRDEGRRSVHLSPSYDMHLENNHIFNTVSGLSNAMHGWNRFKWPWFVNNPHRSWVCCMELFWSAFI